MLRPRSTVRRLPVLWEKRDGDTILQRKYYIIGKQNALNGPGYIARVWAYYNTFRGDPIPTRNVTAKDT